MLFSASRGVPLSPVCRLPWDSRIALESVCVVEVQDDKVPDRAVEVPVCDELGEGFDSPKADDDLEDFEDRNERASKRRRRMFHIV